MHTIHNPELIPPSLIYKYDHRTNQTWNISEYRVPRQYLDPALQVKERQWATQKKAQKDRRHVTKRGFYMDYDIKIASGIPGSNKHGQNKPWSFEKLLAISKNRKVDKKLIKKSFLDQIQIEQKNRKKPGIGTYSLQKSLKQKDAEAEALSKKKYFVGEKHFYHDDTSFLADKTPGSGNYNPHDEVNKIRLNKTDHSFWLKKHKEQHEKHSKRDLSIPSPSSYHPMYTTFTTFDFIQKNLKDSSKSKQKSKTFGTDARFQYARPDKKKMKEKRPDPMSYKTAYEWRTTKNGSPKFKPWNQSVSKGLTTLSVYH